MAARAAHVSARPSSGERGRDVSPPRTEVSVRLPLDAHGADVLQRGLGDGPTQGRPPNRRQPDAKCGRVCPHPRWVGVPDANGARSRLLRARGDQPRGRSASTRLCGAHNGIRGAAGRVGSHRLLVARSVWRRAICWRTAQHSPDERLRHLRVRRGGAQGRRRRGR